MPNLDKGVLSALALAIILIAPMLSIVTTPVYGAGAIEIVGDTGGTVWFPGETAIITMSAKAFDTIGVGLQTITAGHRVLFNVTPKVWMYYPDGTRTDLTIGGQVYRIAGGRILMVRVLINDTSPVGLYTIVAENVTFGKIGGVDYYDTHQTTFLVSRTLNRTLRYLNVTTTVTKDITTAIREIDVPAILSDIKTVSSALHEAILKNATLILFNIKKANETFHKALASNSSLILYNIKVANVTTEAEAKLTRINVTLEAKATRANVTLEAKGVKALVSGEAGAIKTLILKDTEKILHNIKKANITILTNLKKVGDAIEADVLSTNATLHKVISGAKGELLAVIRTDHGTIITDLKDLNAKVVKIEGNTATIQTDLGVVKTDVAAVKELTEEARGIAPTPVFLYVIIFLLLVSLVLIVRLRRIPK